MRHPLLVEGRPNCARQSLASALSAPRVAATSYCHPGRHANVITPCLLTPCLIITGSLATLENLFPPKKFGATIGCTPKGAYGNTAFWEGFWEGFWGKGTGGRVLGEGFWEGGLRRGFYSKKGSEKGSQKGFSEGSFQKVPRTPPCRVRPLRRALHKLNTNFLFSNFSDNSGFRQLLLGPSCVLTFSLLTKELSGLEYAEGQFRR